MNAERRFSWRASLGAALLLAMACPASASAGNIFMKNGYIIQGRIVDRDPTSVILGWPNGKVAIARRFVESVEYEHAEEERIRQLEQARQESPEEEDSFQPTALAENTDEGELPASLEMFIQKYQLEPLKHVAVDIEDPVDSAVVSPTDPAAGDPVGGPGVDLVPDATTVVDVALSDQAVESESALLAMRPPKRWSRQTRDGFLAFAAEEGDGVRPSLNVVSMDRGSLSAEDFVDLLRAQQKTNLVAFELLSEGPTKVGERPAYEISGRCSHRNHPAIVRQILVHIDDRVWLFSAFAPEDSDKTVDDTMALVDAVLGTVTFRTDASRAPAAGAVTGDPLGDTDATTLDEDVFDEDATTSEEDVFDEDTTTSEDDVFDEDTTTSEDDVFDEDATTSEDDVFDEDTTTSEEDTDTSFDDVDVDVDLDDMDLDDVDADVDVDDVDVDVDDVDLDLDDM